MQTNNVMAMSKILGFKVSDLNKEEILKKIDLDLKKSKTNIIFNINPVIVTNFYKDDVCKKEFNKESYQIPDGVGILFASKLNGNKIKKRITGIDIFNDICKIACDNKYKIVLYGGRSGVGIKCRDKLLKMYPNIKSIDVINGYVDEKKALKKIKKLGADILFVGTGSPKQEKFIIDNKEKFKNIKLIMPIGGTLDVICGDLKRAPKIFLKLNLEWFYRMIKEPKRIKDCGKLIKFVFLVTFKNNHYNR